MNRRLCLTTILSGLLTGLSLAAPAQVYEAQRHGVTTRLSLRIDGARFEGRLEEPALALTLRGTLQGRRLAGHLHKPSPASLWHRCRANCGVTNCCCRCR